MPRMFHSLLHESVALPMSLVWPLLLWCMHAQHPPPRNARTLRCTGYHLYGLLCEHGEILVCRLISLAIHDISFQVNNKAQTTVSPLSPAQCARICGGKCLRGWTMDELRTAAGHRHIAFNPDREHMIVALSAAALESG